MSLKIKKVQSSCWEWQNNSEIHKHCLGHEHTSSLSKQLNHLKFSKEIYPSPKTESFRFLILREGKILKA
jgi:hypothetical protein